MAIKMSELPAETRTKDNTAAADGKITAEEWNQFSEAEQKQLTEALSASEETNWFSDWLKDKDKVCTDGKDDGSLSFGEAAKSFGKGLMGIVKGVINHPIATTVALAAGTALTIATGGAALPVIVALGAGTGAVLIGKGAYDAATAETDGEAKAAWEEIGNGTFALAASAIGAKSSLNAASKAGVTGAQGAENLNIAQATVRNFKVLPEALKVSGQNIKGNALTWTTGNIHAHSSQLQGAESYMSKANDVQAYRFNPNGTPEEILANNPGVFRGADGKYYLPNKWSPNEPYLIDTTKEQMIMLYGGDDMAVCDGAIFKGSYVDTESFHSTQALNYQDPAKLNYGQVVNVTKQAPGAFKVMPEGTEAQTLEGPRTVGKGEVVAIDHEGNPYVTSVSNILKRNTGFSDNAMNKLADLDPAAAYKYNAAWMKSSRPYDFEIAKAQSSFTNPEITQAITEAANQVRNARYTSAYRSHRYGIYTANAVDIKEQVLLNKGVTIDVRTDDYYGRTIVGISYFYKGKEFNIPLNVEYHEALDKLITAVFEEGLPADRSIFQ